LGYNALFAIIQDWLKKNVSENWLIPKAGGFFYWKEVSR
jgi:hypothetical protein